MSTLDLLKNSPITVDNFYKKAWANFYLCSLGLITVPAVFLFLSTLEREIISDPFVNNMLEFMLVVSLFTAIPLYNLILSKNRILQTNSGKSLEEKMQAYIAVMIIGLSNAFTPCIVGGMLSMFAGDVRYVSVAILSAALFYYLRPTKERIAKDMQLNIEEKYRLFGGSYREQKPEKT